MRRTRCLRLAGLLVLAGASGCTHNHYYYGGAAPLYETPAVVQYGQVCEVPPAASGGTSVIVSAAPRAQEPMLISRPQGRLGSRMAWRRPDPEGLATTRVEGGLDDSALR